ncbi:MAG: carbohydrate kinase family protein [Abitibacteriaceae bacterium]|nr:carbohydrate kinase family protein [Abditibacteriaceae bacterium]
MADVVCLGILVADVVARPVDEYPKRGQLVLCDDLHPSIGGCAANTAIGLQKLGVATGVMGKVGRDGFGDFVRDTLQSHHLDVRGVATDEQVATSSTMVMVASDGERSFIHYIGANAAFTPDDVNWDLLREAKLLHIAGYFVMPGFDGEPCAQVLKRAKAMGLKTSLDTAGDQSKMSLDAIRPALPYVDYLVPSIEEARSCLRDRNNAETPEQIARIFQAEGAGVVALKMGEAGSYIRTGEQEWTIPPFRVPTVDATGAGDAYAAGFLAGVLQGYDLPTTGKLANAVGAMSVTAVGTVQGIRSLDETLTFIERQSGAEFSVLRQ